MKKSWNNPLLIFVKYFLFKSRSKSWLKVARVVNLKLAFTEWFFYNLVILIKLCKIRYLWNKRIILADAYLNNFIFVTVWNKVTAVWNKNLLYSQMKLSILVKLMQWTESCQLNDIVCNQDLDLLVPRP